MPSINVDSIPARLQTALVRDGDGLRITRALAPADVEMITAVARGDQQRAPALTRHRAISVLATAVQPDAAIPILAAVAREASASRSTRIAAVAGLGEIVTPDGPAALVTLLGNSDPHIEQATIKSLGQVGTPSVLPLLDMLAVASDVLVQQQRQLTKAVIAHRAGLPGPFLVEAPRNPQPPAEADSIRPVSFVVRSADETADDLTRFQGPDYAMRFSARAYRIHCGRADWSLFVNGDLGSLATSRLLDRPWLAGLFARWMPPDVANATQYLLLTRPDGESIHLDVVRTDGEIIYTGAATVVGETLPFDIADVERPQTAPTRITGVLSEDGFRLDVARVARTRVSERRAVPIEQP